MSSLDLIVALQLRLFGRLFARVFWSNVMTTKAPLKKPQTQGSKARRRTDGHSTSNGGPRQHNPRSPVANERQHVNVTCRTIRKSTSCGTKADDAPNRFSQLNSCGIRASLGYTDRRLCRDGCRSASVVCVALSLNDDSDRPVHSLMLSCPSPTSRDRSIVLA